MTDLHVTDHAVERYRERIGTALGVHELRAKLAELLRPATEIGVKRCTIGGVTFCFQWGDGICAVTTVYQGTLPRRRAPRSEASRKERKRRMRQARTKARR